MGSRNLVVRNEHPWRRKLILTALVVCGVGGGWGLFYYGQSQAGFSRLAAMQEQGALHSKIDDLMEEKKALQEQVTILKRNQTVDSEAYGEVRDSVKQLQEEILELREEVDFYRGIVSPAERMAGLNIQTFKLDPAGEDGLYHYKLVLTQVLKNDRIVRGSVKMFVQGVQNGEPLDLEFADISPNKSVNHAFRFRYFQKKEGDIRLPEGFVPRTVSFELSPRGRKKINKSFPWTVENS